VNDTHWIASPCDVRGEARWTPQRHLVTCPHCLCARIIALEQAPRFSAEERAALEFAVKALDFGANVGFMLPSDKEKKKRVLVHAATLRKMLEVPPDG
jgi:hypothetical protein